MAGAATDAVWIDVLPSMQGFGPALARDASRAADSVGKDTGTTFGKSMLAGVAVVAGGAALATKALYNIGSTFNDLSTSIAVNTGKSGADLDRLTDAAKRIGQTVPRSFEDIGSAVSAVSSNFAGVADMSDTEFDRLTTNALNFSKAFEIDLGRATQVAGQMLKSGLVTDANQAFDLLTAASQKVPVSLREDLLDATDEYGPFFAQLGLSGEDAMNALVKASEKGMYGIDKTGDALKEFTIRATDMSTASKVGFDLIGMSQEEMAGKLLQGGEVGKQAFAEILDGIMGIQDPVAQSQAALALFGTPLEDLSTGEIPQFIDGLRTSTNVLGEVEGAAGRMGEQLNSGPGAAFQLLKNRLTDILAPAAAKVFGGLSSGLEVVTQAFSAFSNAWKFNDGEITSSGFNGYVEMLGYVAHQVFDYLKSAAETILPIVGSAFETVGGAILGVVGFFRDHDTAAKAAMGVVALVAGFIAAAWVAQGVTATIEGAKSVAAWFATATAATTSSTIQSRSTAQIVVGWLAASASATVNAVKIAAAWALGVAQTGVLMAMYAAQSISAAATSAAAWVAAQARTVASLVATAAGFVVQGAVMVAQMAATAASVVAGWVVMGAQSLLQAARIAAAWLIAMGPIAIVIAAVVGLVAVIIANWDTIKEWTIRIWDAVVGFIKDAAQAIWSWVTEKFTALRDGVIAIFTAVRDGVLAVWHALRDAVVAAAQWIWDRVVQIFELYKAAVIGIFTAIRDLVLIVWHALRDAVIAAAQWIWDRVVQIFGFYRDAVVGIFTAIRDLVVGIWNGFRDTIIAVANWIWTTVTGVFTSARDGWVRIFQGARDLVVGVWNGLRDTVVNTAQNIWDWVVQKFNALKDGAVSIFTNIRDLITSIWNGIVEAVKSPIRIVFGFVNNSMIDPINGLLDKFPGNLRIPRIPGFRKGGYTGDGHPDEAKGIVHAGEYVFTQEQVKRLGLPRIEAIANGAVPRAGEIQGATKHGEIGGPLDFVGDAWNATGGRVVTAVGNAVDWAKDMVEKGARVVAESVLRPLANAAKGLTPNNVIGNTLDGIIDKIMNGVLGKSDEYDREARSGGGGDGGGSGVPAGDGSLGRNWSSLFATIKAIVPQARVNSSVRNTPDAHGRGKAVDFGFGTGPGGAGSAGLALIKRVLHDRFGKSLYELIYNGVGNDRPNLKNSKPLAYSASIQAQHRNHVHAAVYDQGGLWEPGTAGFNFTGGVERVLTPPQDAYFRKFVDLGEQQARGSLADARPVHLYTPDIPHAIRALREEEQQREALAPTW